VETGGRAAVSTAAEDADGATAGSVADSTRADGDGNRSPMKSESLLEDFTG
jgi:hypothetical protein